jgi:hypothetical protein
MLHTQLAALALAVAAVTASGCGSSKTTTTTTAAQTTASTTTASSTTPTPVASGAPLSRAQWIAQGDAICERTQDKINTLAARNSAEVIDALPQAAIYYTTEVEDLSKLTPPKSMAHDWEVIINNIHLFGEYTTIVSQNIKGHRVALPNALRAKVAKIQTNIITTAKRDGFKECAIGE